MLRSTFKAALVTVIGAALVIGCSKKQDELSKGNEPGKNPPSIPMVNEKIDPAAIRTPMDAIVYSSAVDSALIKKGLYTPDNCIQWVKISKDGKDIGTYLEISAKSCLSGSVVDEEDVLLRLTVKQHEQFFTQYHVYNELTNERLGIFRRLVTNSVVSFELEGMCDVGHDSTNNEAFEKICQVAVESSFFRSPRPFTWYPQ